MTESKVDYRKGRQEMERKIRDRYIRLGVPESQARAAARREARKAAERAVNSNERLKR